MMKYDNAIVDSIVASIKNGEGRVNACKKAGISYQTFCRWYNDEMVHEDFIIGEFREHIKRAEEEFTEGIKQMAIMSIIRKFPENWQAAAWWLERKHKDEFSREVLAQPSEEYDDETVKKLTNDQLSKIAEIINGEGDS